MDFFILDEVEHIVSFPECFPVVGLELSKENMLQKKPLSMPPSLPPLEPAPAGCAMTDHVRVHYETHPYPYFSYLASVRACDTYALNIESIWARANGTLPPAGRLRALLAGCGSFSPYPASLANPDAEVVALDLSEANLRRARIHAMLHGCRNISFRQGDLLDPGAAPGPFAFIDAFGVLHHLCDPEAGLRALERRLAPGGVIRIMVYSRQGRREEESIRRALRLLGVNDIKAVRRLAKKAGKTSRFGNYLRTSPEAHHPAELADALLHPQVTTYRVDELPSLISGAGLQPLFFAHRGALADVRDEVDRLRRLEQEDSIDFNFIAYLGRTPPERFGEVPAGGRLLLNPVLQACVRRLLPGSIEISPRLGFKNPVLDRHARAFLRTFVAPRPFSDLDATERLEAERFLLAMFLVAIR